MADDQTIPNSSPRQLDRLLAPDLPDLSQLSIEELDVLSGFNLAITEAANNFANQPRCTDKVERIMEETSIRAWHFVQAIAEEVAARAPVNEQEKEGRWESMLRNAIYTEELEDLILRLAREIDVQRQSAPAEA